MVKISEICYAICNSDGIKGPGNIIKPDNASGKFRCNLMINTGKTKIIIIETVTKI